MIIDSLRGELYGVRRRPGIWIAAGCWSVQIIVFAYAIFYIVFKVQGPDVSPGEAEEMLVQLLPQSVDYKVLASLPLYGGPVMLIIGVLISSSDYRWGTLQTILSRCGNRAGFLSGRFFGMAVVMFLIALLSLMWSVVCSIVIAVLESRPLDFPGLPHLMGFVLAMTLVATAWGAFGFVLGVLTRSATAAIAIGLVWTLGVENGLNALAYTVPSLDVIQIPMLSVSSGSFVHAIGAPTLADGGAPGVVDVLSGPVAVLILASYIAIALAVSLGVFRRRDVTN